ncbi:MAG TPA: DUF3037 domain-containing protein [Terriglobales bacterium]|nr:DUF3037 domain-containing protein [Terriglobales bacterium]
MGKQRQYEYFLLRYAPNPLREEWINFGVVLLERAGAEWKFANVRFAQDWRRVLCIDPDVDIEMLEALKREFEAQLGETHSRDTLFKKISDSFSNLVQVSPVKASFSLAEPVEELETLAHLLVEPPNRRGIRVVSGREEILGKMRDAFENAGVLGLLMHDIPVAPYTRPGDPLRFDFAYRVKDTMKIFHAVSLKAAVDRAMILAARYPSIKEGMMQAGEATPLLTAIVDDDVDRSDEHVRFALGMMEEAKIRIEAAAQMPAIAELARLELKA